MKKLIVILILTALVWETAAGAGSQKLLDCIKAAILSQDTSLLQAKIEISIYNPEKIPDLAEISFKVSPDFLGKLGGRILLPVLVYADQKLVKTIYLNCDIKIHKKVLVAARKMKPGQVFGDQDLQLREENLVYLPHTILYSKTDVLGKECRTTILAGRPVLNWMARDLPLVQKGKNVKILSEVGRVRIEAFGKALEDGYQGEVIRVTNLDFKNILRATVKSSQEVTVGCL